MNSPKFRAAAAAVTVAIAGTAMNAASSHTGPDGGVHHWLLHEIDHLVSTRALGIFGAATAVGVALALALWIAHRK